MDQKKRETNSALTTCKGEIKLAFLFTNEEVYNSAFGKKRRASGAFKKTYYAAQPLLGKKNQVIMEAIFGVLNDKKFGTQGLLIATKENLYHIADKAGGHRIISWSYNEISSITILKETFTGFQIDLKTQKEEYLIKGIQEGDHDKFVNYVRKEIQTAQRKNNAPSPAQSTHQHSSDFDMIASEIRKYAELKEEGLLTEEEFTAKKKQLLQL
ncbi:SHOCT domain-containing protein [Bacillus amyloliquefaciens]|uniref:SHOCT domain-containing protein n=1 Tax=Bacillus amyloliquefaciens TaxID=1390 RepID=UPI000E27C79C|nr:SHOCT domain-containing protein [Bacillus amyloliquefaciens]RDY87008.1 hypothetical protein C3733_15075 [Bacillus amyloliquefaciens]